MASTVRLRPNHYETLGLKPDASAAEIERAFAREIGLSRPRAFGGVVEVSVAYETLKDPAKRRAYDLAMGFVAEPMVRPQPTARWNSAPFIGSALTARAAPQPDVAKPVPAPAPVKQPLEEPRTASFIAASLRKPEPKPEPRPEPRQEAAKEPPRLADRLPDFLAARGEIARLPADDRPIEWQRTAIIAGVVVAAVGLIGGWAGWEAGNDVQDNQLEQAVTVKLPKGKPQAAAARAAATPSSPETSFIETRPRRSERRVARAEPAPSQPTQEIAAADAPADPLAPQPSETAPASFEQAAVDSAPAAAASMPLPKAVIARTIGRIGYPCGSVASTTPVGGAAGVFRVTCSSGHSYQASPVHGRYRFRRLR